MNDKRTLILCATEALLAQHGFHGLSMQMVAKQAGVAAGTIYRYFTDKDDLLVQLQYHMLERCAHKMTQGLDDAMPVRERFEICWLNLWNMLLQRDANALNRAQYENLPRGDSSELCAFKSKIFAQLDRVFTDGKAQGLFKPLDNEVLGILCFEPCNQLARKQLAGILDLNQQTRQQAMHACWDAISI